MRAFSVVGDATAGAALLSVVLDPKYCHLVSFMTAQIAQTTSADADLSFLIAANRTPSMALREVQTAVATVTNTIEIARTWSPPALILPGGTTDNATASVRYKNVDTDVYYLDMWAFLFDIRVRELTPMGPLLWARGST